MPPDHRPEVGVDEEVLIGRVLDGDRGSFAPLVERYESAVLGLCRRWTSGWAGVGGVSAEDLAQETFLRAYRKLGELSDRRRFGPWLYQIARSSCRDWRRRQQAERRALDRHLALEVQRRSGRETDDGDVSPVLAQLPERERLALELKYFEGLSYREIASRLGTTFAKVDHLIRQARERLSHRVDVRRRERERAL